MVQQCSRYIERDESYQAETGSPVIDSLQSFAPCQAGQCVGLRAQQNLRLSVLRVNVLNA
jgi:hypothetical protein